MKKLLILICLTACATEANNNPTQNFCQTGDTACQCEANPSLPQCGDQPITPEQAAVLAVQQDTADYVAGIGGTLDPGTVVVEKFEQWHTTGVYNAGFGNF